MENYKPNSHKAKKEQEEALAERKVEKVIKGSAKTKKRSDVKKFADVFISEDAGNVKSYIIMDVLIPAIKKAISDIVTNGIDIMLYGETGRSKKKSPASKISYRSYYESDNERRRDYSSVRTRSTYEYDDIVLDSRGEAESVLATMDELVETYGMVSVADLYEMVGVQGSYTDNKYGWTKNIRNASVVRVRDGYLLKLPKALPFD